MFLNSLSLCLSLCLSPQNENIWHILVLLLLLGFWSYFGCGKWIHQDRQTPWSSPSSPSPLLLTNPKLLSMVSSWPWRVLLGEEECWLSALTCTPSKSLAWPPPLHCLLLSWPQTLPPLYLFNFWKNPLTHVYDVWQGVCEQKGCVCVCLCL